MEVKEYIRNWLTRQQPRTPQSSTLDRKQIFILPTRAGIILAFVLMAMLMAALNYNNSLAFIFTFLIAGIALNAMWFTHRQLSGLTLSTLPQNALFASQKGKIRLLLENPTAYDRYSLMLTGEQAEKTYVHDCPAGVQETVYLDIQPDTRGLFRFHRLKISTQAPLGIFYAWSWQTLDLTTWVYPNPVPVHPLPLQGEDENEGTDDHATLPATSGDDFDGLREYRPGDSPQHISWKHHASKETLMVKQFSTAVERGKIFSWDKLPSNNVELKLSQLCQCVIDAEHQNDRYGLELPGIAIDIGNGETHYRRCLLALAQYGASV